MNFFVYFDTSSQIVKTAVFHRITSTIQQIKVLTCTSHSVVSLLNTYIYNGETILFFEGQSNIKQSMTCHW